MDVCRSWSVARGVVAVLAALAVLPALMLVAGVAPASAGAASAVRVTVNAGEGLGTIPATGYGLNSAVWDSQMNVPAVRKLLGDAHIGMLRYPGGSYGDIYHWQTNTAPGGYVAPGTDFDAFMGTADAIGAQPMLIANYGSGTPAEAAAWVKYANVTKGYGATYWEIGNEVYGNGYYGSPWETDEHTDKSPAAYAHNVLTYESAMKAVDPSIKVGAVLTLPGNWPDGVIGSGDAADWNHTVLSILGGRLDFAIVHWYPPKTSAATMLTEPSRLTGELAQLRAELRAAGAGDARIALTELNSGVDTTTQPDALFGADAYLTALQAGVLTVDWWDTHNGLTAISTAPDGATDYDDWGILSSGGCVGDVCEPAVNTPFPPYYAIKMLGELGGPGDQLVRAGTDDPLVAAHAVRRADGDLGVLLVNKDPDAAHAVALDYAGYTPDGSTPTVSTYRDEASAIDTARTGTATSQTLPPYSITTVTLHPRDGSTAAVSAPGAPRATAVTDTTATLSWSPSTGDRVDRYEVYRQHGTDGELLATSTGTGVTLHNLTPGTSYTLNVLARDQAGRLSRASEPVRLTTGSPAGSSCLVSFRHTAGWGNGYNASVTITDTGPSPIDGWTLAFTFPSDGESITGYWNAKLAEDGTHVVATPVGWNAELAAGGGNSVSFGFTGANTGAAPAPPTFTLNGTVCTTG